MSEKKYIMIVAFSVAFFIVGVFAVKQLLVKSVTKNVIESLQKDYSPSPYGPGLNPDKVDYRSFKLDNDRGF